MPKFTFMGLEVGHRLVADVQGQGADGGLPGKVDGGFPSSRRASSKAARQPEAVDSTYPSTPGDLAGKDDAGLCLHPVVPASSRGESR